MAQRTKAAAHVDALLNRLMRTREGERCVFKLERMLTRPELYVAGTEPALPRWIDFLEQIGNRNALYALMEANPESVAWASRIFAEGGRHAPPLIRHPEFLESFLAMRPGERLDSGESIRERFRRILDAARDEEEFLLDLQTANAHARLTILSRYLEADAMEAPPDGSHRGLLAGLAEAVVDVCARFTWRYLVPRYGVPHAVAGDQSESATSELAGFAVLAMGKLGSRDMRFGSDLDLVFVYGEDGTTTKGRSHWEFYTKLAQKLTALLSAPTQFGVLLDLDHRLRPFGGKGLLVPSVSAYRSFLSKEAEVWNFQAFTRARHLCGEAGLSVRVLAEVARAWAQRKNSPRDIAREVLHMAQRLAAQSPPSRPGTLQLKYGLGGMLGFEFLRQCYFLLSRQEVVVAMQDPEHTPQDWASRWTVPDDHEIIQGLMGDYDTLGAVDERVSFYIEPFHHEVDSETFRRLAGVQRRWSYDQVVSLCQRMKTSVEAAFRDLAS